MEPNRFAFKFLLQQISIYVSMVISKTIVFVLVVFGDTSQWIFSTATVRFKKSNSWIIIKISPTELKELNNSGEW